MTWLPNISGVIEVEDTFFRGSNLRQPLHKLIADSHERKIEVREWFISSELDILSEAIEFVREKTRIAFTTAILKEYRDWEPSWAYKRHADPERFFPWSLFLCTLEWEADFSVWDKDNNQIDIEAIPDRAMIVGSRLDHQVSPPKNSDRKRSFLFMWVED